MSPAERSPESEVSWIQVTGKPDAELARILSGRVKAKVQAGDFSWFDVRNIADVRVECLEGSLQISTQRLERLRRLCQVWDIDIRPSEITSHRKFVGPFIVAFKKIVLRIVKVLLRDTIRQQRDFNATVITLLAELTNEQAATTRRLEASAPED